MLIPRPAIPGSGTKSRNIYFLDNLNSRLFQRPIRIAVGPLLGKTLGSARHKALVDFLIARREAAGLTQAELAKRLGEYQSFVARMESGQRRIDVVEFLNHARVLDFDPAKAVRALERVG